MCFKSALLYMKEHHSSFLLIIQERPFTATNNAPKIIKTCSPYTVIDSKRSMYPSKNSVS